MICPHCKSNSCHRLRRSGVADALWYSLGLRPWRCTACQRRFHARQTALRFVWYASCPRCGNLDLQRIASDRVEKASFLFLRQKLAFPAYRCDPCPFRFFRLRPAYRVRRSREPHYDPSQPEYRNTAQA